MIRLILAQVELTPDASGLPGKALVDTWVNALAAFGLAIALGALIVSAVVWAVGSNSQNYQHVQSGKRGVLYSLLGAVLIGGAAGLVNFFFTQGVANLGA